MSDMLIKAAFFDLGDTLVTQTNAWVPGGKAALARLRLSNIRLGIISNTGNLSRPQVLNLLPADFDLSIFDSGLVIFSSEVQVEKPDPRIFRLSVERAGLEPGECLFCTEDLQDTLVAQLAGMRTARLPKPPASDIGALVDKLAAAGLILS